MILLSILILTISCEKDKSEPENTSKTNFKIGDNSHFSTKTNLYITDYGRIVETYSDDFQLFIVLSDNSSTSFKITDTLKADDEGTARCVLKIDDDYHFSIEGTIDFDANNKTGNMTISFEDLNLDNGKLIIDSIITKPYIDFTKITLTDMQGVPMNNGDPNDWIVRNDLQLIERLLFNEKSELIYKDLELIEYPNPFNDIIKLRIDINQDEQIDLFFVNENFEIEQKIVQLESGNYALLLDNPDYDGNYYRLYYKVYSKNAIYYGSGDLKVEE